LGSAISIPPEHAAVLQHWAQTIRDKSIYAHTESNLRGAFIDTLFVKVLGYAQFGSGIDCTIITEKQAGSGAADVALGHFTAEKTSVISPVELKGPDTRNLDAVMPGRYKSPVTQVWEYANDTAGASVMVVSNMLELRVYVLGRGKQAYERFDLLDVASDARQYQRLVLLLGAKNLLSGAAQSLLDETKVTEREITQDLYADYKRLRVQTIIALVQVNGDMACEASAFIPLAQKILDRVLFVAFCEDRGLLPERLLESVIKSRNAFNPTPHWDSFKAMFRFIDVGSNDPAISAYNGGLFAPDAVLDALQLPDDMCEQLAELGKYDFDTDIPVTVLGHIFEQSIEDLEKLQALADAGDFTLEALQAQVTQKTTSVSGKRKIDGIVYTPDFITRFIVEQTVGQLLTERQATCRMTYQSDGVWRKPTKQEIKDYKKLAKDESRITEYLYWQAWLAGLRSLKICDPACGSGAFLIAAFEALEPAYQEANEAVQSITGTFDLFDTDKDILTGNLYGVDLNAESIEISMLSLWLKTAKRGKKLENLSGTLKVGNSVIGTDSEHAGFDWAVAFPEVVAQGGFDVVIGNPPYVRMEILKPIKPYLEKHYEVASDRADLYAYFFERGVQLLKEGGRLGYISSSTFFKTGSGEPLRRYLAEKTQLQSVVDFGDVQVFEGVTTYPAILVTKKNTIRSESVEVQGVVPPERGADAKRGGKAVASPISSSETEVFPPVASRHPPERGELALRFLKFETTLDKELGKHFAAHAQPMLQAALQLGGWQLEGDAASTLRSKLTAGRKTLKEVFGSPLYGIKTGLNEAFVLNRKQRDDLIAAHPPCSGLLKPFLEGKDLKKWRIEPQDLWLIYIPKNKINIDDYPSIKAHLLPFKQKLEARATKQAWFELQQAQEAYQTDFETSKIFYPDLSQGSKFSFHNKEIFAGNTIYFLPTKNVSLVALLNSKAVWFYLRGVCEAMRGGEWRLRMFSQNIESIPIPEASPAQKQELARLAEQAQAAAEARRDVIKQFGHLVSRDFGKPPAGLVQSIPAFADFTTSLKKIFKRELTLQEKNDWEATLDKARETCTLHTNTIAACEQAIDRIVYQLFELTSEEIAVVEGRA
jgi:hypothetical protein